MSSAVWVLLWSSWQKNQAPSNPITSHQELWGRNSGHVQDGDTSLELQRGCASARRSSDHHRDSEAHIHCCSLWSFMDLILAWGSQDLEALPTGAAVGGTSFGNRLSAPRAHRTHLPPHAGDSRCECQDCSNAARSILIYGSGKQPINPLLFLAYRAGGWPLEVVLNCFLWFPQPAGVRLLFLESEHGSPYRQCGDLRVTWQTGWAVRSDGVLRVPFK